MKTFSIIIPMFNSEKYIERTINSILNQTYKNYEIILIDDCSTDSTISKCMKYLNKNVRLINLQKNLGASNARNVGLQNAIGDFIIFLDSDDWLDKNTLSIVSKKMNDNDLIVFGTIYKRQNEMAKQPLPLIGEITKKDLFCDIFNLLDVSIAHWITNKALKSSIIKEYNLYFNNTLKMGEDLDFCLRYLEKTNKINILNKYLYFYDRTNDNSLTNSNLLSLPERTKFNIDNIESFLIRNNLDLKNFKNYKKNLCKYVENKINQSTYSQETKEKLLENNMKLNGV